MNDPTPELDSHLAMHRSEWLTVRDVAELLKTRESHVRALVAAGGLPVSRIGRLLRFHGPTLERWLLEGGAHDIKASP